MNNLISGDPIKPPTNAPGTVKLSAAQSYANYLKYKQALEEEPDRAPWVIVWMFAALGACSFMLIIGFGYWWLFVR